MRTPLCDRCESEMPKNRRRRGFRICGICEILEAGSAMISTSQSVPKHYNYGLGMVIEDKDHLKKVRKEKGLVDADWGGY